MASTADPGVLEASRLAFLRLLRAGVQAKVRQQEQQQQQEEEGEESACSELVKSGGGDGEPGDLSSARALRVPAWQALAWRDAFSTEPFFEASVCGRPLRIKQVLQGELNGFGTGLTVGRAG